MSIKLFKDIRPIHSDERGDIIEILDAGQTDIKSTLLITCTPGAIRANHYHKKDSHYCYMLAGSMEYYEQPIGGDESQREMVVVKKGDMVYTPPMVVHAMKFLEDSVFLTLATTSRRGNYEDDTVRIKLI